MLSQGDPSYRMVERLAALESRKAPDDLRDPGVRTSRQNIKSAACLLPPACDKRGEGSEDLEEPGLAGFKNQTAF